MLHGLMRDAVDQLNWSEKETTQDSFFDAIKVRFNLTSVAYLGVNLPSPVFQGYYFHATYSDSWVTRYQSREFFKIDPVVRRGLFGVMPVDWSDLGALSASQMAIFNEAHDFGVGNRGLSFPLHGLHGERAVFSITADMSESEWHHLKRKHLKDFRIAADVYHQHTITSAKVDNPRTNENLTRREVECLRWSGEGKTYAITGEILNISPRAVRLHLENARAKLGCLNTTHAVATALLRGLI